VLYEFESVEFHAQIIVLPFDCVNALHHVGQLERLNAITAQAGIVPSLTLFVILFRLLAVNEDPADSEDKFEYAAYTASIHQIIIHIEIL